MAQIGYTLPQFMVSAGQQARHILIHRHVNMVLGRQAAHLVQDNLLLQSHLPHRHDGFKVKTTFQGGAHLIHALVAGVGRADHIEARAGKENPLIPQLRHVQHFVTEYADQTVLHFRGRTGDLLKAGEQPLLHAHIQGRGNQRLPAGALGQQ